ncbi:hypothetical protein [Haloechinothrix sp. LS1_15]|nr:hypothetical protein [Haloechinothrix sp. LS1_15]
MTTGAAARRSRIAPGRTLKPENLATLRRRLCGLPTFPDVLND